MVDQANNRQGIAAHGHPDASAPAVQGVKPVVKGFHHEPTGSLTYLVTCPHTRQAAIIDPVLDYDHSTGRIATESADQVLQAARDDGLDVVLLLETHAHADHLSAAPYMQRHTGAPLAIGAHIRDVQHIFRDVFNLDDLAADGSQFDRLLQDGDSIELGALQIKVIYTPGHTPACVTYHIGDAVFVGDTVFMPDYGTARADFPGGDARALYRSIRKLLALPPQTRMFMCHDYKAPGRDYYAWETTVAAQRAGNIHIRDGVPEEEFVAMRTRRDSTLAAPRLLLPSIQVNIRAGNLPGPEDNGTRYLKIPLRFPAGLDDCAGTPPR